MSRMTDQQLLSILLVVRDHQGNPHLWTRQVRAFAGELVKARWVRVSRKGSARRRTEYELTQVGTGMLNKLRGAVRDS